MPVISTLSESAWLLLGLLLIFLTSLPGQATAEGAGRSGRHRSVRRTKQPTCECGCDHEPIKAVSNARLLADWHAYMQRRYAKNTVDKYDFVARDFLTYLAKKKRPKKDPKTGKRRPLWPLADLKALRDYTERAAKPSPVSKGTHLSDHAKAQYAAAIRNLFRFAHRHGYIGTDKMAAWEPIKIGAGDPRYVPRRLQRLIVAEAAARDERMHGIVWLMLRGGARCIEAGAARIEDVQFTFHTMAIRGKGHGGKISRRIPVDGELYEVLAAYLAGRPGSGPLFPSDGVRPGRQLAAKTVTLTVNAFLHSIIDPETGRPLPYTAHDLRHTWAKELRHCGRDADATRVHLGHVDQRTTDIYTGGVDEHVRVAAGKVPPMDQDLDGVLNPWTAHQLGGRPGVGLRARSAPSVLRPGHEPHRRQHEPDEDPGNPAG